MLSAGQQDQDKVKALMVQLVGSAGAWLLKLRGYASMNSEMILGYLVDDFGDDRSTKMQRLESLRFHAGGNLSTYIRKYAAHAYSVSDQNPVDQADKFIHSLPAELTRQIRMTSSDEDIRDLQSAFKRARKCATILGYDSSDEPGSRDSSSSSSSSSRLSSSSSSSRARVQFVDGGYDYDNDDSDASGFTFAVASPSPSKPLGTSGSPGTLGADAAQAVYTALKSTSAKLSDLTTQLNTTGTKVEIINTRLVGLENKVQLHDGQLASLASIIPTLQRIESQMSRAPGPSYPCPW